MAVKKIDLSCCAAAGIFLKVVLKTHKDCFLKAFLNGSVSQILNYYIADLKLCEFLSRRRWIKVYSVYFHVRLYAIKFQTPANCSTLINAEYSAYKSCLVGNPYYSSFAWP